MKNSELAQRIKDLRIRRGLSQEKLSDTAQINLRTVQRIESGETDPRGDTLKRIANALNVTPDELIDWTEQEDKGFLAFFNLSALSFMVFPLLGIIVPLAIWILKKDKIKYANEMGKRLLNFQITWSLLVFLVYAFLFFGLIFHVDFKLPGFGLEGFGGSKLMLVMLTPVLYIVNGAFVITNSIRSYQGKRVFYKPAIRFLR